jgi:hypothetical protein
VSAQGPFATGQTKNSKNNPMHSSQVFEITGLQRCEIAIYGIAEICCAVGQNRRMMASWQGVASRMALREKARWS